MSSACSIDPAGVISPALMKKISSAFAMVFSRCAMMTLVVDGGSFAQDLLEQLLGDGVDVRRRFVEDQDLRLPQHRAHEGDELLLPQADAVAAGGHLRLEPLLEAREQAVEIPRRQQRRRAARRHSVW